MNREQTSQQPSSSVGPLFLRRALAVLTGGSGAYLLILTLQYVRGGGGVRRHHLEAASFIFVALLVGAAAVRWRELPRQGQRPSGRLLATAALIAIASAVWLYGPAISSGRFADDFVLLEAARQGRWTVWSDLVRPTIFFVWRLLDRLVGDPSPLLHLANILLHGSNAWMVFSLALRFQLTTWSAAAAAALFLSFPASVEAVVWPSGFQDVAMTTLVLSFLLLATSPRQTYGSLVAAIGVLLLACVTKETAVVAPALAVLVLSASACRNWRVVAMSGVTVVLFLCVRFAFLPLTVGSWLVTSRYALKESVVRPFASLLVPFRAMEVEAHPLVIWILVVLLIGSLCVAASRSTKGDDRLRLAVILSVFVLVSIAPLFRIFIVTDDLHGSRYLYLGSVAWAILLARLYAVGQGRWSLAGSACAALTLVVWVVTARVHQRSWLAGADLRDQVLAALGTVPAECSRSAVYGLPKVAEGVPIFLNGFAEAARERRPDYVFRFEPSAREDGECRLTWNGGQLRRD